MSKLDRDLTREAALRAKYRRAGCSDPRCEHCGEEKIWRLAFVKGRPPICRNCLADRTRNRAREAEFVKRCRAAGFSDPRCIVCGERRIWRLELDHIAGRKHDDTCAPLCCNCHEDRTFTQRLEIKGGENPTNVFETIGRFMLGLAQWFELLIEKLYEWGEFLIGLARQGYGGDIKFP